MEAVQKNSNLTNRDRDLEDGEREKPNEQRDLAAKKLRERTPDDRS
jgi:hypothetical protein